MDRLTRKELKTDKFAEEVGHTFEFLEEHRKQAFIVGGIILALIIVAAGGYYYQKRQHLERQEALTAALQTYQAPVTNAPNQTGLSFKTEAEKNAASEKEFNALAEKYPGSPEAAIAKYYLGVLASSEDDHEKAERLLKEVMESGSQPYTSQAAFSLAQLYAGQSRTEDAEKLLRNLVEHPTILVSKEQATIALANLLAKKNPEEARKLLEPLRSERSAVSRAALSALGQIPQE